MFSVVEHKCGNERNPTRIFVLYEPPFPYANDVGKNPRRMNLEVSRAAKASDSVTTLVDDQAFESFTHFPFVKVRLRASGESLLTCAMSQQSDKFRSDMDGLMRSAGKDERSTCST